MVGLLVAREGRLRGRDVGEPRRRFVGDPTIVRPQQVDGRLLLLVLAILLQLQPAPPQCPHQLHHPVPRPTAALRAQPSSLTPPPVP